MEANIEIAQSLFKQNKYQETIDTCNQILTTDNNSIEAIKLIAKSFLVTGKIDNARLFFNKALTLKPDDFESIKDIGNTYQAIGDSNTAKNYYKQAIEINSSYAPALTNLGRIELQTGNKQEALSLLIKATESNPQLVPAWSNLANCYLQFGKAKEAETSCLKAIELNPNLFNSHFLLASILIGQKKLQEAEQALLKTIELKPDYAEAHLNLGAVLNELGNTHEAKIETEKSIKLNPSSEKAHLNLGTIFREFGRIKEAEKSIRKAIQLNPDYADAYFNLSLIELLHGDYQSGLRHYELRTKTSQGSTIRPEPNIGRFVERELKKGEKLLVVSEQAPGDVIFHMRYLLPLKQQGIDLSFCAPEKLHSLIKDSGIHANPLSPEKCSLIKEGEWIPLLSLLKYFSISPQNPLIDAPYISSTKKLKDKWRKIFLHEKRPIVGINWQGSQAMENTYRGRSFPLEKFSKVLEKNDIRFLSLQKGFGSEQRTNCSFKKHFVHCQEQIDEIWDYSETSAIIENCDLIITNDCSMGPLAAGMGKKVWLLLRDIPFWYWGLTGESTFWYPSMRLFRQQERHNWDEVMQRVSIAMRHEIQK